MTFRDFKAAVNALPAHDLATVPCDDVTLEGCDVALPGTGDADRITELEGELRDAEKEIETGDKERTELAQENERLKNLLADFKCGELTVLQMRERMENAEDLARRYRKLHDEMLAELTALRKRKGVDHNLFTYAREVRETLYTMFSLTLDADKMRARAKELHGKIFT